MIDLHTHILPDVDDGIKNKKEAADIACDALKQGISKIVATPHYLPGREKITKPMIQFKVKELQDFLTQQGIDIEILPGMEIYLTPDLVKQVDQENLMGLNDSQYLLIELPMNTVPKYAEDVFYDLQILGYQPIIAHPERYKAVIEDPNLVYSWINQGVLAQLNGGSLLGMFGRKIKKTAEVLVKHNLVQLVASDLHSNNRRKECLGKVVKKLDELKFEINYKEKAEKIIKNDKITTKMVKTYRKEKGLLNKAKLRFGFWKNGNNI